MRTLTLVLAIVATGVGSTTVSQAAPYAPKLGQRHPDFTLPAIDDRRPVALSDFRGKKVLLIQFSSW